MTMTDILDETFELYKTNFWLLIGISAVINIPLTMISGIMNFSSDFNETIFSTSYATILSILALPLLTAALTIGISERYLDREITIADSYNRILKFNIFIRLLTVTFIKYLFSLLPLSIGFAFLLISIFVSKNVFLIIISSVLLLVFIYLSVYLYLKFSLVDPAVVLENKSSLPALKRSWNITKNELGKIFLVLLIATILVVFVQSILSSSSILQIGRENISFSIKFIGIVFSTIGAIITTPVLSICVILLYYDMRIRKEGFDLEMLASMINIKNDSNGINNKDQGSKINPSDKN